MPHRFLEIATGAGARAEQMAQRSRAAYARMEVGPLRFDRLGPAEQAFIKARDNLYIASVGEAGWPYVQHRGGPAGFLTVLDDRRLAFADLSGNRQYLTLGNIAADDRIAMILMDYPNRRRLKLLGRMRTIALADDPNLAERLVAPDGAVRAERMFLIAVEAFDWNCAQHITPRFTEAELAVALAPVHERLETLTRENAALRARLAQLEPRT